MPEFYECNISTAICKPLWRSVLGSLGHKFVDEVWSDKNEKFFQVNVSLLYSFTYTCTTALKSPSFWGLLTNY